VGKWCVRWVVPLVLGYVPDDVTSAPTVAVARLAERLGVDPGVLAGYGGREQTRTDHLREVLRYRGWRSADALSAKELDEFLLARAMEHDSPSLLFGLACEHLRTERVVRPGPVNLLERVAAARHRAERETHDRVAHLLTPARRRELDGLLRVNPELGMTRLRWLATGPTEASAAAVKAEVGKLEFLRGLDAHTLDLSCLPAERRRHLAAVGRRSSIPALTRREPHRRYPIVLTLLTQSAVDVLDEVVQLFDQAVSARESKARHTLAAQLAERAKQSEDKLALAEEILPVLADPGIADEAVGGLLRERIGMGRLAAALAEPSTTRLPRDHGHLGLIEASYSYLRQFTPDVLRVLEFAGGPVAAELLEAVGVLRDLNARGARSVPADAPTGFVPARWRGYLDQATAAGNAPRIGTTGSCACCSGSVTGCAAATCTCPARGATPTRPPTSSRRRRGRRSVPSSAPWSASPPIPLTAWLGPRASGASRSASSRPCWPPAGSRCVWTRTASW